MAQSAHTFFLSSLLFLCLSCIKITGTTIDGSNNTPGSPGGSRFNSIMGMDRALTILSQAEDFVQSAFDYHNPTTPKKTVDSIHFVVEDMPGGVAFASGVTIHLSADYVAKCSGDVFREMQRILYHEMAHIWQWSGKDGSWASSGLIEGVADFVTLKAGLAMPNFGAGQKWDEGYMVTASFLYFVDSFRAGFVAELNKKLAEGWNEGYFQELTGRTLEQLWDIYKSRYNH